jgi:hypothetical protein
MLGTITGDRSGDQVRKMKQMWSIDGMKKEGGDYIC